MRFRIHPKSILKMRSKIKELTGRSNGLGNDLRKGKLSYFIKGWINYFKYADIKKLLTKTDSWYRRRLRMVIWKQWKKVRTRWRNLIKLGIISYKAWEYANTRKGYWHIANSHILSTSITNDRLDWAGYMMLSACNNQVKV